MVKRAAQGVHRRRELGERSQGAVSRLGSYRGRTFRGRGELGAGCSIDNTAEVISAGT